MKKIILSLLVILILLLTGCVSRSPAAGESGSAETPGDPQDDVISRSPEVEMPEGAVVIFRRSGGFAGVNEEWVIYADGRVKSSQGEEWQADPAAVGDLLAQIDGYDFFSLRSQYIPANPCCDLFSYELIVNDRGRVHLVATVDGADAPEGLQLALQAVQEFIENSHR